MTSIKFTGADGQDIDTINGDTQFRITLDTGRTDGPDTLDVVFKWDDGDDSDTFTITKMEDGRWKMEDGRWYILIDRPARPVSRFPGLV